MVVLCAPVAADGERLLLVPKGQDSQFWDAVVHGAKDAAKQLNVHLMVRATQREGDIDGQRVILSFASQQAFQAVVLAPSSEDQLLAQVEQIRRQGIPIVVIDSSLQGRFHATTIATNNHEAGQRAGHYLAQQLGKKGNVLITSMRVGNASTDAREQGFRAAMASYPAMQISQAPYLENYGVGTVRTRMLVELKDSWQIRGIFTPNETTTTGTLLALRQLKLDPSPVLVGFDETPLLKEAVAQGEVSALMVQSPYNMGYKGVEAAIKLIHGQSVPVDIDTGVSIYTQASGVTGAQ